MFAQPKTHNNNMLTR